MKTLTVKIETSYDWTVEEVQGMLRTQYYNDDEAINVIEITLPDKAKMLKLIGNFYATGENNFATLHELKSMIEQLPESK
jgi:hypothetical protein